MKVVIGFVALFALAGLALGGPLDFFRRSPCASGDCANGMCSAPVAFQAPIAKEAPKEVAAAPCACGIACPCADQVKYAAPAPYYAASVYQESPTTSAGISRRGGLLSRIFHRRR